MSASETGTVVLSLNSGSSSLKFGLFQIEGQIGDGVQNDDPRVLCSGEASDIGGDDASFSVRDAGGKVIHEDKHPIAGQEEGLQTVSATVAGLKFPAPNAVGHRVVHGGPKLQSHQRITPEVLKQLEAAAQFAPLHVPIALRLIHLSERQYPGVPQFACFDTAFHRSLSEQASRFALPEKFWDAGVRRYGFHGLSCESILHALGTDIPRRVIIAHLGNGASITAVADGASIDTTMGLTPTGGIVMGTRTGDLDPGALLYILRNMDSHAESLEKLVDEESGLLGISGLSADMRDLHQAGDNLRARMAIDIFCRVVKKALGAFIAVLGGLDLLVFTGGIGEHDAAVREEICSGLAALGIELDPQANQKHLREIHSDSSQARVNVIESDEDGQIARHTYKLLRGSPST